MQNQSQPMETRAKIEAQEKTLSRLLDWIKAADSKSQIVIALDLAMIGSVVAMAPEPSKATVGAILAVVGGSALQIVSLFNCIHVSVPLVESIEERLLFHVGRLRLVWQNREKGVAYDPKHSLLFFGTIARMSDADHAKDVKELTEDAYLDDLIAQCKVNAEIANVKYSLVKDGTLWMFRGAVPWLLATYYLYR